MAYIICKFFGHSYIAIETQNWGQHYFDDGGNAKFLGSQVIKLWCQRCHNRIDDVPEHVNEEPDNAK